ncbi:HalOD1 output domain-containing protein [Halostella litorea]|uniref:HalOD1 output domain-containing protein n=1 Tax=Halostella litorea TaxID=2528831 RepID=UPI001091A2C9|nr:HalOD1 output domain-containing protein [Halostella litorea]
MNCLPPADETRGTGELVVEIAERVADEEGVSPLELPPLADALDAEVLEQLIDTAETPVSVGFEYLGHTVVVCGEGEIELK